MYDQTGSTDSESFNGQGFRPNPNGGFSTGPGGNFHGFQGQNFDPNAYNQFKSSFSGFGNSQGRMGGMGGF